MISPGNVLIPLSCRNDVGYLLITGYSPIQVKESTVYLQEEGVRLELTVVDTPGFGDVVDNTNW